MGHITGYSTLDWEYLEEKSGKFTFTEIRRVKVHGGWLVESTKYIYKEKTEKTYHTARASAGAGFGVGLAFIPDPKHEWKGLEIVWKNEGEEVKKPEYKLLKKFYTFTVSLN